MPLVVKLKAIALDVGKRLRGAIDSSRQPEGTDGEAEAVQAPAVTAPGETAPLTGVLPKVELTPASTAQQRRFARQCTLQAVFDWYQGFLERETARDLTSDGGSRKIEGGASMRAPVPGFPQFAWQLIETEPNQVRARFFDAGGREAGALLLRSEADRCVIEVPDGSVYVATLTTSLPDFTRNEGATPASTLDITGTEKQRPATQPSPVQDPG